MLLDRRELAGIRSGTITAVFRHWTAPRVRVGTRLRTPIGLVEVLGVAPVEADEIGDDGAQAAGFADRSEFDGWLEERPGDLYRIDLRPAGPDPRVLLAQQADMDESTMGDLRGRLSGMDSRTAGPWTWQTLRLIHDRPGRVSTELAGEMGIERHDFKRRVRRLKELGLTESLETGYRLTPRGEALLAAGVLDD